MVLKSLKFSLSLLAGAASVGSLFAVSWVGLALLGYWSRSLVQGYPRTKHPERRPRACRSSRRHGHVKGNSLDNRRACGNGSEFRQHRVGCL